MLVASLVVKYQQLLFWYEGEVEPRRRLHCGRMGFLRDQAAARWAGALGVGGARRRSEQVRRAAPRRLGESRVYKTDRSGQTAVLQ